MFLLCRPKTSAKAKGPIFFLIFTIFVLEQMPEKRVRKLLKINPHFGQNLYFLQKLDCLFLCGHSKHIQNILKKKISLWKYLNLNFKFPNYESILQYYRTLKWYQISNLKRKDQQQQINV